jgi:MerR family transcriptional regulator, light-induced transcriptional regulator
MSVVRTNAAAAMLGVSPNTLRSWERRFSYPSPRRSEGGHRQFELTEIETLRQALAETHNISSAISIARERGAGVGSLGGLREALQAFDQERADRLLEESLAVRSVERTVQSTLLATVQSLRGEQMEPHSLSRHNPSPHGPAVAASSSAAHRPAATHNPSPEYGFAWRYASGWLAAAQRVAPAATRAQAVAIFDASRPLDMDALYVQALELFLRRAGWRVLTLPLELQAAKLGGALRALRPQAMVLGGAGASLDAIGRLVYAVRQSCGQIEVLDYRGALPDTGASTVTHLGSEPQAAVQALAQLGEDSAATLQPALQRYSSST